MDDLKIDYITTMFADYPDIVDPKILKKMLGFGRNKTYNLLKTNAIYNKRIGSNYIIPKVSVIEYLMKK